MNLRHLWNNARQRVQQGNLSAAVPLLEELLAAKPEHAEAWKLKAAIAHQQGQANRAISDFERALALSPQDPALLSDLGNLLRQNRQLHRAQQCLEHSLAIRPDHFGARYNHALVLQGLGQLNAALTAFDELLKTKPSAWEVWYTRAVVKQDLGEFLAAEQDLRKSLRLNPQQGPAWLLMAHCRRYPQADPLFDQLAEKLQRTQGPPHWYFALAKVRDDQHRYTEAFELLKRGNRLVEATYDSGIIERRLASIVANKLKLEPSLPPPQKSPRPLFIIGLPRSGTSLLEQMLSCHPAIFGGGELLIAQELLKDDTRPLNAGQFAQLRLRYMEQLPSVENYQHVVTDKLPSNIWRLAQLAQIFPESTVVLIQREPEAVALSNYFQLYERGNSFANSLKNLAHYIACEEKLIAHWLAQPGDRLISVSYRDLVGDSRRVLEQILDRCGLSWDEACLHPEKSKRAVTTASSWQVRQPIYQDADQRWHHYRDALTPFTKALDRYRHML